MARSVRFLGGLSLLVVLMSLTSCASWSETNQSMLNFYYPHASSETLNLSPHEHQHAVSKVIDRDNRALIEDLDLLFLTERPTRLHRWHSP